MGCQHTHAAITTSIPARTFGEFGKTSIPVLNPTEPADERQQVNGSVLIYPRQREGLKSLEEDDIDGIVLIV